MEIPSLHGMRRPATGDGSADDDADQLRIRQARRRQAACRRYTLIPVPPDVWRVVIADDDIPLRTLVAFALDRDGRFEIVGQAGDGVNAIRVVDAEDPDLLLLDVAMPQMDGLQVLAELTDRDRPVIAVLTGIHDMDLEHEVHAAGAAAYLTKGVAFDDLGDRLAKLF